MTTTMTTPMMAYPRYNNNLLLWGRNVKGRNNETNNQLVVGTTILKVSMKIILIMIYITNDVLPFKNAASPGCT